MVRGIVQYGKLAKYYDILYQWKDYRKEALMMGIVGDALGASIYGRKMDFP